MKYKIKYKKLIGYIIDTNQFTKLIESKNDAIIIIDKLIATYGINIFDFMFLTSNRFSTFTKKESNLSLNDFLK